MRSLGVLGLSLAFIASSLGPAEAQIGSPAAAPANDNFASATTMPGSEGSLSATNVDATKESGEPNHGGDLGGTSIWFTWTPPASGPATIGTAGSSFDTVLGVYTGSSVNALSAVAGNDDAAGAAGVQSAVSFFATAATVYRVAVDGYSAVTGSVTLRWSGTKPPHVITVSSPNGGESVVRGSSRTITYTYANPLAPAIASSTTPTGPGKGDLDFMLGKARQTGSARSIVGLAAPFRAEGALTAAQAGDQRAGIAEKRLALLERLKGVDHSVLRTYDTLPLVALRLSPAAVERLRGAPEVASISDDLLSSPSLGESTPLVEGPAAFSAGFDGTGQTVAVLDTGTDGSHPFLAGKVVEEACYSGNANCPNGTTTQTGSGAGVPCTFATGACPHGTHVAGIVAGSNATSSGVGKGAGLMAVQVFSRFTGTDCGGGEDPCARTFTSDQIAGLERVFALRTSRSFASVNMSLGGGSFAANCDSLPQKLAIDNLRSVGIATVIASGNNGFTSSMGGPACISTAISVGASTKQDAVASFSNSASFLSLLAPGSAITSSIPGGAFASLNGTSMATPHVAGAWAVLKQLKPSASVSDVLAALQATGRPVLDGRNAVTKSRIRLQRAMTALDPRVRIELLKAGAVVATIADNLPVPSDGNGSFVWAVPAGLALGTDYTIRVTSIPDPRSTDISNASFTVTSTPPTTAKKPADFDGDGDTDRSVYRNGAWFSEGQATVFLGNATDIPVPANYDNDADTDRAVYRDGTWFTEGQATAFIGLAGDIPVPGDYDGDGDADRAIFRPSVGGWYVEGQSPVFFGLSSDIPVPGDYDNNGTTDRAVFRPSVGGWYVQNQATVFLGLNGDIPVPGDYDNNGTTDRAVFRPSVGGWYVQNQATVFLGLNGDIPVPGDYNGDGDAERGIWRKNVGGWYIEGLPTVFLGLNTDIPLPLPQAIYRKFFTP